MLDYLLNEMVERMAFNAYHLRLIPRGDTNKIVQTAFDDTGKLIHQKIGKLENNLYDVKIWNVKTY